MTKPSERIEEIYNSKTRIFTGDNDIQIQAEDWIESITQYLDEEYEKNKTTGHPSIVHCVHEYEVWNDMEKCMRCGKIEN